MNTDNFDPGFWPVGDRIIILPEVVEEKSTGGILLTHSTREREEMAQIKAKVIAIGPTAWATTIGGAWCRVGQYIGISKWAGAIYEGKDGRKYRVINDVDVVVVFGE